MLQKLVQSVDCKEAIITLFLQTVSQLRVALFTLRRHFVLNCFVFLTFLGDSGVWGLKKNFALLELLERLQNGATNQSGMAEDALKGMGEVRHL